MKTKLLLVGGFLGAGKTSLLWEAARLFAGQGRKTGLITNDQASDLVDTSLLLSDGNLVQEVSGSCFCCNFPGLIAAVKEIAAQQPGGVILAEPVGSCTDLSATLMQPLKERYADLAELAPLTVLADPARLQGILDGADSEASYIVQKQFEEADLILINKMDLLSQDERNALKAATEARWPGTPVMTVSVKERQGISEWLETILGMSGAGHKIAQVDYDIYAAGEAAYGWLNASYTIGHLALEPRDAAERLLDALAIRLDSAEIAVGHVKFLLQTPGLLLAGNLTGTRQTGLIRQFDGTGSSYALTVNARAETDPDTLSRLVSEAVEASFANCRLLSAKSLIPGRPNPTYRYANVQ